MCCTVYESLYMVGIQMNRKCVRACLHWRPLHVPLHSSFQQSTMGKQELLHHLAALVCFVAESWPISQCMSSIHFYYTQTPITPLFFIQWWQSVPQSDCITSLMHFQHCVVFFSSSSPFLLRDESHRRTDDEQLHNSFIFRAVVHGSSYVLLRWSVI